MLFVAQFEFGKHWLLGENVLGHIELQVDTSEHHARQHSGNQNSSKRAGENHEEKVVACVYRREHEDEDSAKINDSFARQPVVHLIDEPAQTRASRKRGDDGDCNPAGEAERNCRRAGGNPDASCLRRGGGK